MKKNRFIAGFIIVVIFMTIISACTEEGQFYSSSVCGFEFSFPSGWLFAEEPNGEVKVYKEGVVFIYIKDLTDDINNADYEYPLIDRAEYAAEEFLTGISGGDSAGIFEYMFTEDALGGFVTGSISDTIYIGGEEMLFTLTITKVGSRMVADVTAGKNQKILGDTNKARKTIMDSIKTVEKD